jgi:hypothetical protein
MGSFFICKSCHNNTYLVQQKEELLFPQSITCALCAKTNIYLEYEVQQERYDLSCPICKGRFFIRRMPPITIKCPHSNSLLYVSSDGSISVVRSGTQPTTTRGGTVTGALGGLVLGALLAGTEGAFLGTLAGAALGSTSDVKEAIYV